MSCHYPSCMMGGGDCPYRIKCEEHDRELLRQEEEKRKLDLAEQKARIAFYEANTPKKPEGGE